LTPEKLASVGRAVYGERWQTALARDLHISDRTIRRWSVGSSPIPASMERDIWAVVEDRSDTSRSLLYDIEPAARAIHHALTGACFRWSQDEGGNYTLSELTHGLARPDEMPAIRVGAEAKLRRERGGETRSKSTRIDPQRGRGKGQTLYGFMRGSVIIPPDIDLTEPTCDEPFDAEQGILHR
jgi:hypothetical protein